MNGSWHRYRPGERWRRPRGASPPRHRGARAPSRSASTRRSSSCSSSGPRRSTRASAPLGPDLLDPDFDEAAADEAVRRLRDPARAAMTISAALLDQRALAGIGNIWRNETLFVERTDPFATVASLDDAISAGSSRRRGDCSQRARRSRRVGSPMRVYRRAGRPCPRCGTLIQSARWRPSCRGQPTGARVARRAGS